MPIRSGMARHKTIAHLPAIQAPAPPPSPRLFAQLMTAVGALVALAIFILGVVTLAAWVIDSRLWRLRKNGGAA
jgi:hypothetical protein